MLQPADLLVLDEPTNDLDIPTLEVLEEAIATFPGATLLVTHDRSMLATLASRIVVLGAPDRTPRVVTSLAQALRALGEFEHAANAADAAARSETRTAARNAASAAAAPTPAPAPAPTPVKPAAAAPTPAAAPAPKGKLSYNEQRELGGIEASIAAAEGKATEADAKVNDPKLIADHVAYAKACDALSAAQSEVARLYARWQELEAKRG
jgi:ATP-binding cassette subfamily F protein uup